MPMLQQLPMDSLKLKKDRRRTSFRLVPGLLQWILKKGPIYRSWSDLTSMSADSMARMSTRNVSLSPEQSLRFFRWCGSSERKHE